MKKLSKRSFKSKLKAHIKWLSSCGESGQKMVLESCDVVGVDMDEILHKELGKCEGIRGVEMRNCGFRNCHMSFVRFADSVFTGSLFDQCFMDNCEFTHCEMDSVYFYETYMGSLTLKDDNLDNSRFHEVNADRMFVDTCSMSKCELYRADFNNSQFYNVRASGAHIQYSNMSYSYMNYVDFYNSCFVLSSFINSRLMHCVMSKSLFSEVDLTKAVLSSDMCDANLVSTKLFAADLSLCGNIDKVSADSNTQFFEPSCPMEGEFIGWKKVLNKLVKLRIPEDAKRSSATTYKCRCEFADVLDIIDMCDGTHLDFVINDSYAQTTYKTGSRVYPDGFDENRWKECGHGIHFFVSRAHAEKY